jgi:hypothetical protein
MQSDQSLYYWKLNSAFIFIEIPKHSNEFLQIQNRVNCINEGSEGFKFFVFVCLGFYVTLTQYRSYRDVPVLLVEEDLRCFSMHYFRHEQAPE